MSDTKRRDIFVLLFLFAAIMLGFIGSITDFSFALNNILKGHKATTGSYLTLINGFVNLGFALYCMALSAAFKSHNMPVKLIDMFGLGLLFRLFFVAFILFKLIPLEGPANFQKFKFLYTNWIGLVTSWGQAAFILFSLIALGMDDEPEPTGLEVGRDGVLSVDHYIEAANQRAKASKTTSPAKAKPPTETENTDESIDSNESSEADVQETSPEATDDSQETTDEAESTEEATEPPKEAKTSSNNKKKKKRKKK